ncbi:MAG: hypothetical protein BWY27_00252 [Bacteroidetes bacterium ADurb.Bin234]|jgi:hypothetical protein|nr:MAG: hypothetical protein BWY27_00252 [Bacteroidetes bacterium ADurb.Bin234]
MYWYHWTTILALSICISVLFWHFIRLISLGKPKDYSRKSGSITKGVVYSSTKAMVDHKESAYLHIPTYFAGMVYHIGTFVSLFLYVFFLLNILLQISLPPWLVWILVAGLLVSSICGFSLFIKRLLLKPMRNLSNLDDYLSNFLVSLFQLFTLLNLLYSNNIEAIYYIIASLMLLYMTVGKLKHMVYFFAARYHLGFFYGWRNVWPPHKSK